MRSTCSITCGRKSASPTRVEDVVEGRRPDHLAERELDLEGLQIILERDQLLAARRLVDAVHDRRLLRLQRLGRRDIGGDHIILDQLVRVEPLARRDREDPALLVEHHPPLRQVELQRRPFRPRRGTARASRPRAARRAFDQRPVGRLDLRHRAGRGGDLDPLASSGVDRRLRVLIGDVGRDPDAGAGEAPALQRARPSSPADGRRAPPGPHPASASRCRRSASSGSIGTTRSGK